MVLVMLNILANILTIPHLPILAMSLTSPLSEW